jgi:putative ABC transport system permease protein
MLATNLKTALRGITRNKVQSSISILGLGIGFGCIILLLALILHETSFNKFIPDHKNVYRIIYGESGRVQYPLGEAMKLDFPEVKDFFRFYQSNNFQLRNQRNELVRDNNFGLADPSIYSILGIKFISGTSATSLTEVAISKSTALKYFGNLSPIGDIITVKISDTFTDLSVSGIYEDFPSTSTLHPDFIADIKLSERMFKQFQNSLGDFGRDVSNLNWNWPEFLTFVVIVKNADALALSGKMGKYKELIESDKSKDLNYSLQPVRDIYLGSRDLGGGWLMRQGNASELKYYEVISLLILIIAVTNYILLKRASTAERLKELGTRKVFGASRVSLRNQIILESNLVALISLAPAIFVIKFGMSFINNILYKTLSAEIFSSPLIWLLLCSVILFTGTVSGLLIGYNFSRIPVISLLTGRSTRTNRSNRWSYSFLVLHFSIYIILLTGVLMVTKQIKYSLSHIEGINPENILISELSSPELKNSFTAICDEIQKLPGVENAAGSSFIPPFNAFLPVNLQEASGEKVRFDGLIMGEGMTELLKIEVIDGESFGTFREGPPEVLFNESTAFKYNVNAGDNFLGFKVKGIVKDFHAHSLHTLIQPMVILQQNPAKMSLLAIKTNGTNDETIIKSLRNLYMQIAPDEIFEVKYLTDQIEDFYRNDKNQGRIIGSFSLLATVLSIMGLFGIALISISRRTKEIGIRKVNGASVFELLYLLNVGFVKWVMVAIIIATPVSIYILTLWLKRFAYKTDLSWWIFTLAGISAIVIALLTTSWQSIRTATRNPAEALRYE